MRHLLLLAPIALASAAPAQRDERDPAAIEKAYRARAPYRDLDFTAVHRPPFLFLLEKGAGRADLARASRPSLGVLLELFEKRFGRYLGRKRRDRPFVVWLLKDEATYHRCGGARYAAAHNDPIEHHVVSYTDPGAREDDRRRQDRDFLRENVKAFLDARTGGAKRPSAWLYEGIGEYLATLPPRTLLAATGDPGFRFLDEPRIQRQLDLAIRGFDWSDTDSIEPLDHPLYVTAFHGFADYLRAVGLEDASPSGVAQQMRFFRNASYAVVVFYDLVFKEVFRARLLALLRGELKGVHGLAAVEASFKGPMRDGLEPLFAYFVQMPSFTATRTLAKGKRLRDFLAFHAGGKLFDEPAAGKAKRAKRAARPAPVAVGRGLQAFARYDAAATLRCLEGVDVAAAAELRAHAKALSGFLAELGAKAGGGKLRMYLPGTKRPVRWDVAGLQDGWLRLVDPKKKLAPRDALLGDLPPLAVIECAFRRKGVAKSAERLAALGLVLAMHLRSATAKERKRILSRAKRSGIRAAAPIVAAHEPIVAALSACARAEEALAAAERAEPVLTRLANELGALPKSDALLWLTGERVARLLEVALWKQDGWVRELRARAEPLPEQRVRLVYDWKDRKQSDDWVTTGKKSGFLHPWVRPGRGATLTIDSAKGTATVQGAGHLRHRVQFQGDVSVTFTLQTREVGRTAQAIRVAAVPPGDWLLCALRPSTFVAGGAWGLDAWRGPLQQVRLQRTPESAFEKLDQLMLDGGTLTLRRRGTQLELLAGDETIVAMAVRGVPRFGAVLWGPSHVQKDKEALAGRVVIEGRPHPRSMQAFRTRFVTAWRGRFPR